MQFLKGGSLSAAIRAAPSPKRGRKKEHAGYGVCQENRAIG